MERNDFHDRFKAGTPISVHEFLYPLMQGYDSVALKSDLELGGTDQKFNLLVGRDLMRSYGQEPQCILTMPILEGIDAREEDGVVVGAKMSKSLGNTIGVDDEPGMMFGKIMSVCDGLMWRMYTLLSNKTAAEIDALKQGHPKAAKVELARELVARYHGAPAAAAEVQNFEKLHSKEGKADVPDDAPRFTLETGKPIAVVDALAETQLSESKTKARALIAQGGLFVNGERVVDVKFELSPGTHAVRVGKKAWARITVC